MSTRALNQSSPRQLFAAEVVTLTVLTKDAHGSDSKTRVVLDAVKELEQRLTTFLEADPELATACDLVQGGRSQPAVLLGLLRCEDELSQLLPDDERLRVCIDTITTAGWPLKDLKLALDDAGYSEALLSFDDRMDADTIGAIRKGHRKQLSRLMKGSVARSTKLAMLGGSVLLSVVTVGAAAPAIGGFIGATFLGLSGAAATSAGLALLGGGSLASGGLGMAGGIVLVKLGTSGVYKGATRAAIQIARSSRTAFIAQLATLHVYLRLAPATVEEMRETLAQLDELRSELVSERDLLRAGVSDSTFLSTSRGQADRRQSDPRALRRVEGCLRALDVELRELRGHRSKVAWVTRVPWGRAKDVYDLITH